MPDGDNEVQAVATPEQLAMENLMLRNEILSRDLDNFQNEVAALQHEVSLRNAIIVIMMDGKPRRIVLNRVEKAMGTFPVYTQTKTLLKLGLPDEDASLQQDG